MPKDDPGTIELTITPEKISGRNPRTGRSLGEGPYTLDPAGKTLDASRVVGSGRGTLYRGIYSLQGDTLEWCATNRKQRPTELAHRPGQQQFLMILRRQK